MTPAAQTHWSVRGTLRGLDRFADALYGYDVFIAYRQKDAKAYAKALYAALEARGYSCFIDSREYKPGEPLAAATGRHAGKATVLAVLCTPALLERREPDWVLLEIETFLAGKTGTAAKIVPIEFADTLSGGSAAKIAELLRGFIYLHEEAGGDAAPAPAIVEALAQTIGAQRRDGRRQRFFRALAAIFFVLSVLSVGLAAGVFGALRQSERNRLLAEANLTQARNNLAELYMDEARGRLAMLDVGGANAFAAAALGQADRADARRLILEHPALTTRLIDPMPPRDWAVWALAYDKTRDRFMFAGSDGDLWLLDGKGDRRPQKLPGGLKDVNALVPSPNGSHVAIGTYKGAIRIRSPGKLAQDICVAQSDPKGIGRMIWLDENRLAFAADGLSVLDVSRNCAVTAGPEREAYFDLAIDRKSDRLFAASLHRLVRYAWDGGALRRDAAYDMPTVPGGDAPLEPQKIAWLAGPERLAVAVYQPVLLLFDRDLHAPKQVSLPELTAGRSGSYDPRTLEADPYDGRVYFGDLKQLAVLDTPFQGSDALEIERKIPGGTDFAIGREALAIVGAGAGIALSSKEPPEWVRLALTGVGRIDISPDGKLLAAAGAQGRVSIVDVASGHVRGFDTGIGSASWIGFDPGGTHLGISAAAGAGIFQLDGGIVRKGSVGTSPTGFETVTWRADGTALLLGSEWYGITEYPLDPRAPIRVLPGSKIDHLGKLAPLSGNRLALLSLNRIETWDPASRNTATVENTAKAGNDPVDIASVPERGAFVLTTTDLEFLAVAPGAPAQRPVVVMPHLSASASYALHVSADGKRFVVTYRNTASLGEVGKQAISAKLTFAGGDLSSAVLSPDGRKLFAAAMDGSLFMVSLAALDEPAAALSARIGARVGLGRPDLTIKPARAPLASDPRP